MTSNRTEKVSGPGRETHELPTGYRVSRFESLKVVCFLLLAGLFAASFHSLNVTASPSLPQNDISGAELFANNCARCHGADGTGGKGPNLASEKKQAKWKESDEKLIKKITNGGLIMPSFRKKLTAEEIKEIAGHVRTLKE